MFVALASVSLLVAALRRRRALRPPPLERIDIHEDILFVFRDAGETLALLPVAERLAVEVGVPVAILVSSRSRITPVLHRI